MHNPHSSRIGAALGREVFAIAPLSGGCVGEVYKVRLDDGRDVVVKIDTKPQPDLEIEGFMLRYLAHRSALPVPAVLHTEPSLLVMDFIEGASSFSRAAEIDAADRLAALHAISAGHFGFERDTVIGGLHQPNPRSAAWIPFFQEHRLLAMGRQAHDAGHLDSRTLRRVETLAAKCSGLLEEPERDSLLHGDVWRGNVLASGERITGFIDPAIYYGHAEIELAFISLFNTFGETFFGRYAEQRPIRAEFFDVRCDVYNVYPLLVHVRLFGPGYLPGIERELKRHGC